MADSPSNKPRILFLTNSMGTGGVGNQLYNLSTRLQQRGYKVKIRVLSPLGRFGEMTNEAGIDVESFDLNSKTFAPLVLYKVRRLISTFEPDILHTHLFHATIIGRIAAYRTETSTISTIHNTYDKNPEENSRTTRDYLYSLTDRFAELTTFVSTAALDRYLDQGMIPEEKVTRVYNGIDTSEFRPDQTITPKKVFTWITVGNLQEQKDHRTLLNAVLQLKKSTQHDFRVCIIGEGELRQELESVSRELGVDDIVDFLGRVESVPDHLNASDAFVLSSLWEGFGLVVPEAMACQLPVVATNTGGPSEIVEDGKTGFLAERGSPDDLAANMRMVMELTPEQRRAFGERGRKRVKENYSIEQTVAKWVNIYETYS